MKQHFENKVEITRNQNKKPVFIKIIALIILVSGIIGTIYYTSITLYEIYNPKFLDTIVVESIYINHVFTYVWLNSILYFSMVVLSILTLRNNIIGVYGILTTSLLMALVEFTLGNLYGISIIMLYIILGMLLLVFRKRIIK